MLKDLSVVIPVFNNEHSLQKLTIELIEHINGFTNSYEIIYVEDKSTDNSKEVLKALENDQKQVCVIYHEKNLGQQLAILSGLIHSNSKKVAIMDADLQDDPCQLNDMFNSTNENTTCFIKRMGQYQSFSRMLSSSIFKYIMSYITGLHPRAGCYFMADYHVIKRVIQMNIKRPYINIMVGCLSPAIIYQDANRSKRALGKSSYNFMKRLKAAFYAFSCAIECHRHQNS